MQINKDFRCKLSFGQIIEQAVTKKLTDLCPNYRVKNTEQEFGSQDRKDFNLVDVVVIDEQNKPILGIECKRSATPYRLCYDKNGWKPEDNTPLNKSSLKHYEGAGFPFYVINFNQFAKTILVAELKKVLTTEHDRGNVKPSGETIYNFNCSDWTHYYNTGLKEILTDILIKHKLC